MNRQTEQEALVRIKKNPVRMAAMILKPATAPLADRFCKGELEPSKILNTTSEELKDDLTEEKMARNQPEETASMQMPDARYKRCDDTKVGAVDIIQAGHGDRYQLKCIACGNCWFASRDEVAVLRIDGPSIATSVRTAPWATSKFEDVEKMKLLSPRETQDADSAKKTPEASVPTCDEWVEKSLPMGGDGLSWYDEVGPDLRQFVRQQATAPLADRFCKGELEPSKILNTTPKELKDGLTEEKMARNQPGETASMQMTDAHCKRSNERKVGVVDIIQAGHGDRYQLKCIACGDCWFASRDEVAVVSIDAPSNATSVGTAPCVTSKFENLEKKKLLSPRDTQNADAAKNTLEASVSTLETQRSLNKARPPDDAETPKSPTRKSRSLGLMML